MSSPSSIGALEYEEDMLKEYFGCILKTNLKDSVHGLDIWVYLDAKSIKLRHSPISQGYEGSILVWVEEPISQHRIKQKVSFHMAVLGLGSKEYSRTYDSILGSVALTWKDYFFYKNTSFADIYTAIIEGTELYSTYLLYIPVTDFIYGMMIRNVSRHILKTQKDISDSTFERILSLHSKYDVFDLIVPECSLHICKPANPPTTPLIIHSEDGVHRRITQANKIYQRYLLMERLSEKGHLS